MKTAHFIGVMMGVSVAVIGCKPTASPEKKANTQANPYTSTPPYYDPNAATSTTGQTFSIRLVGQAALTSTLQVTLNQPVVWQFEAVGSDGYTKGQITQILVNGQTQHPSMTITGGNTVNFTPRSQQDLLGTLEVTGGPAATTIGATSAGVQRQSFAWSSSGLTNGGVVDVGGNSILKNILMNAGISILSGKIDLKNLDASTITQLLQSGGLSNILNSNSSILPTPTP